MEIGSGKTSINNFIGPTSGLSFKPNGPVAKGGEGPTFMDALRDTFAQKTSGLSLITLPDDKGTQVFTANPAKSYPVV